MATTDSTSPSIRGTRRGEPSALLREVARLHVRAQRATLACQSGSVTQCTILPELARAQPATLGELARRLRLDKGWTSRAVDHLVTAGLVEKRAGGGDRRTVALSLTPDGEARLDRIERTLDDQVARVIARVPSAERAAITRALRALHGAYIAELGEQVPADIRPATEADWDPISALLTASALPLHGAREHLGGFIVATREGSGGGGGGGGEAIVGCAAVERYGDAGLLRSVAVAEQERGTGLGVALVERCVADAAAAGIATLVLLTTTAAGFFPRFGFEVIDRAAVPDTLRGSAEMRGACPASATVMRLALGGETATPPP